jgi:HlyD family secretion protein
MRYVLKRGGLLLAVAAVVAGPHAAARGQEQGASEGPRVVNVFNPVEGRVTVLSCKPEGAPVKKGEIVCELDPGPVNDRLADQEIRIRMARAAYREARLAREAAEKDVGDSPTDLAKQEMATVEGEIALAQSKLGRAEEHLKWSDRMLKKGYIAQSRHIAERVKVQQAKFALEQAEAKKAVLEKTSKARPFAVAKAELDKAKEDESIKKAVYERERAIRARLLRQVEACKVVAPAAGRVGYGRPFGAGAVAHDGDLLFRLIVEGAPGAR